MPHFHIIVVNFKPGKSDELWVGHYHFWLGLFSKEMSEHSILKSKKKNCIFGGIFHSEISNQEEEKQNMS